MASATLMRGLRGLLASQQGTPGGYAAAAAVMQRWPSLLQAPQSLITQQHSQQHSQQPGNRRSLSFVSAARATAQQQRGTGLLAAAAPSPLQQLSQAQCILPSIWQQPQQEHAQVQLQQLLSGQQTRHFVLMPRKVKYRKAHKSMGFNETVCGNTRQLAFGMYGIRALEHARIPANTLEAIRRTLRRTIKKSAMLWIRTTPNVPVTSKPAEVRMGKGKGTLDYWAAPVRAGQIIFEFDRCSKATAMAAVQSIKAKMPIKIAFEEWN